MIDHRFWLDLQTIIVADLLPNLFAATGRAHLGAAAPTLDSVVTIFNGLKQPQLRDPMFLVYEERCENKVITSRMTPCPGSPLRPLSIYKLSIGDTWTILEVVAARWQLLPEYFFPLFLFSDFSFFHFLDVTIHYDTRRWMKQIFLKVEHLSKDNKLFLWC